MSKRTSCNAKLKLLVDTSLIKSSSMFLLLCSAFLGQVVVVSALRFPPVGISPPEVKIHPRIESREVGGIQEDIDQYLLPNQFSERRRRNSCSYDIDFTSPSFSAREARITMPMTALLSSLLMPTAPATAATMIPSYSFDMSLQAFFPTALSSKETADRLVKVLKDRGYTEKNTCFGASICSDEINTGITKDYCLFTALKEQYGAEGAFVLGGLAGIPFVGKSGLGAYAHHVPDKDKQNGKLLVLYGPHVGISDTGDVGKIQRVGRAKLSGACGAIIGAYQQIARTYSASDSFPTSPTKLVSTGFDHQEDYIIQGLKRRFARDPSALVTNTVDPLVFSTYQVYCMTRDLLYSSITASGTLDECDEIALVGGIIINQHGATDYFQPLSFQVAKKITDGNETSISTLDLYNSTFGKKPMLAKVGGKEESVQDIYSEAVL